MPKVRLLAPWTNSKGEPQASGAVIDVSDDEARDLNGRGQATLVEEEEKLAQQQQQAGGTYDARLERDKAPGAAPAEPPKPPEPPKAP
jgi:hypothetical protein